MKKLLVAAASLIFAISHAQDHFCAKAKQVSFSQQINPQAKAASTNSLASHELKYDVKFVHLNLNLERNTTYVSGNVKTVATVVTALDTFMTLLHQNHTIDSLRFNGVLLPAMRVDSIVKVVLPSSLLPGASFTVNIYYKGIPPTGGSALGSGFTSATIPTYGGDCTWSLSCPFVAYHWWPCKQILTDKIDSSWVFVTTDSSNKVGSNGRLKNVFTIGNKKRYEWKSRNPIDYYLISVSISTYKEYILYAKPQYLLNDSILIQSYIYGNAINNTSWINNEKVQLDKMPQVMRLYCNLFGMYPFYKEKYGHCMAPIGGGMEHQTMTSLGFFDYYVSAHEMGHQWWGDNVTCKSWQDVWINEAFAVYSEYLTAQYLNSVSLLQKVGSDHSYAMSQIGGSVFIKNQDTMKNNVIFDGRLTYAKGGAIIRTLQFVTNNDSLWFNTLRGFQNTYKNSTASVIDFKNYYQAQTSTNATQFFNQWYYGEGYPTFNIKYNVIGNTCVISSTQTVSKPSVTPLFITPMEYKIKRSDLPDTIVRVMQSNATEFYSFNLPGTVTGVICDPNNWVINKVIGPVLDTTLTSGIPVVSQPKTGQIIIAPNPSRGIFTVNNPVNLSGRILVWDLEGKLIFEKNLEGNAVIDLTRFAHGLYEARIVDANDKEIYSQKLISE